MTHLNVVLQELYLKLISAENVCECNLSASVVHWRFAQHFLYCQAFDKERGPPQQLWSHSDSRREPERESSEEKDSVVML